MIKTAKKPAILLLQDGSMFKGSSIGADGVSVAEVVFNTSMTGYQEILTDPSYLKQIVTLTYPHIGNTGANEEDMESDGIKASGLVIHDLPLQHSNFRSQKDLSTYLKDNGTVAIAGVDTRRLTRILRTKGAQVGVIATGENPDIGKLQSLIAEFGSMAGKDLAKEVTCKAPYEWKKGEWVMGQGYKEDYPEKYHVVAYDFGVKRNILNLLRMRGCKVTVVPATTPAKDVLAMNPNGVFLSNGPGDPEPCVYAIEAIQEILKSGKPVFGICLGHQLLGLATGGKTRKMKFGHHGANHPVKNLETGEVNITSQNHGFEVDASTLPANVKVTHKSLFDGSVQGIELTDKPAFSFQGHPEASPGPHDILYLFDKFVDNMAKAGA